MIDEDVPIRDVNHRLEHPPFIFSFTFEGNSGKIGNERRREI